MVCVFRGTVYITASAKTKKNPSISTGLDFVRKQRKQNAFTKQGKFRQ